MTLGTWWIRTFHPPKKVGSPKLDVSGSWSSPSLALEVVSLPILDGLCSLGNKKERGNKPIGSKEISEKKDFWLTLPETNSSPVKIDPWKRRFLLESINFRGYVSFREGMLSCFFCWFLTCVFSKCRCEMLIFVGFRNRMPYRKEHRHLFLQTRDILLQASRASKPHDAA